MERKNEFRGKVKINFYAIKKFKKWRTRFNTQNFANAFFERPTKVLKIVKNMNKWHKKIPEYMRVFYLFRTEKWIEREQRKRYKSKTK